MALTKLLLEPQQSGYKLGDPNEFVSTELDGGAPRSRKDTEGGARPVTLSWRLTFDEWLAWEDFYEGLSNGALPFLMDLWVRGRKREYKCNFVANSVAVGDFQGETCLISAQVRVVLP